MSIKGTDRKFLIISLIFCINLIIDSYVIHCLGSKSNYKSEKNENIESLYCLDVKVKILEGFRRILLILKQ